MVSQNTLVNKMEEHKNIRNELFKKYGNRLFPSSIKSNQDGSYTINLNYTRPFNVIDEKNKKIYIRTLNLDDIYIAEINSMTEINLPIHEINYKISTELNNLHKSIEKEVLNSKEIILKLMTLPKFSYSLSRFSRIISRLLEKGCIEANYKKELLEEDPSYKNYFQVLINSNFIEVKENIYYSSNRLKKIFKESGKENPQKITNDETIYFVLKENYSYIINELKLNVIQSYIDLLTTFFYLGKYQKLVDVSLSVNGLYEIHTHVFKRTETKFHFEDRINELKNYSLINDNLGLN